MPDLQLPLVPLADPDIGDEAAQHGGTTRGRIDVKRELEGRYYDSVVLARTKDVDVRLITPAQGESILQPRCPVDVGCAAQDIVGRQQLFELKPISSVYRLGECVFLRANLSGGVGRPDGILGCHGIRQESQQHRCCGRKAVRSHAAPASVLYATVTVRAE